MRITTEHKGFSPITIVIESELEARALAIITGNIVVLDLLLQEQNDGDLAQEDWASVREALENVIAAIYDETARIAWPDHYA